jgi:hypothetical protein
MESMCVDIYGKMVVGVHFRESELLTILMAVTWSDKPAWKSLAAVARQVHLHFPEEFRCASG